MNTNKLIKFWLIATLLCGITVTSCKDDNEENKSEAQKEQEAQEKASKFWNVVGQLVSVDDVTDDYEGKTFEPTYGMPDATNVTTRIVNTNDMKTAAQRFANLVNAKGIDENTPSYTWRDPEIGTMTYTRGGDAANWATVDVDIKAVPGLQRIIYREGGEGTNGKFNGKAYYRFGDVVSRQVNITYDQKKNNDDRRAITEYWICVRPAFGPEGKEDSHWVCVNTVSDKNYKYYKASTGTDYWLPTNLKTDKENMQNFAELLWAICYPDEWYKNVDEHHRDGKLWGFDGVPFFTDFKKANLDLHNQYFWQNVQDAWDRKQIAEQALNMPSLGALIDVIRSNGVRLLYNGYSWIFLTSWNCELSEAVYTNGKAEEELNMHHAVYNEDIERNMKDIMFDVRTMGKDKDNYNGFFNSDGKYRWAIRHATGKELATDKKSDVKKPITVVKEEYRYYRDVYVTDLNEKPEVTDEPKATLKNAPNDAGTYMIGDVVEDTEGSRWFCILGSPNGPLYPAVNDHRATFVSFDNIDVQGNVATNIITEDQIMETAVRVGQLFNNLTGTNGPQKLTIDNVGQIGEHIYNHTGVDLQKLIIRRDSVWRFQNYDTKIWYDSESTSYFFNLAYNDGRNDRQAIARVILDLTQAGNHRTACSTKDGSKIDAWQYRVYQHYEVFDTLRMVGRPNELEASVGMTKWQARWAISEDKMYLDDVASQQMVNKYAAVDKWVRLPQPAPNDFEIPGAPRTQAEASARPGDYLWKNGNFATAKTSIFNEPVLFLRLMYVEDNGGKTPNLVSTDGRRLHIVHMQDDDYFYASYFQGQWATRIHAFVNLSKSFWLDNENSYVFGDWPDPLANFGQ